MRIAAFMDEIPAQGGAQKHFISFVQGLSLNHNVHIFTRTSRWAISQTRRDIISSINCWADIVFVMHFRSVWIIPFLKKPVVLYLLEPPRPFHERWLYKEYPIWKKVLIQVQGRIDRYIVEHYVQHGIANSAFSAEAGLKAYGIFFDVVYPGVDRREFYPEEE
jgi:hypothetical protein